MRKDYNRYELLTNTNGQISQPPFVRIPKNKSDKFETWNLGDSRLDRLASKYYNNEFYDFLILFANPRYISEYDIEDGTTIRIPFPFSKAINDYENGMKNQLNR